MNIENILNKTITKFYYGDDGSPKRDQLIFIRNIIFYKKQCKADVNKVLKTEC